MDLSKETELGGPPPFFVNNKQAFRWYQEVGEETETVGPC